ncbi:hypothetical protein EV175_004546, partial [Coemansia sp. RSA 1933]
LEQQQRQFQQQFLEQYRQMQMQQPQNSATQAWVDDGFTDQAGIPASYHMAGFQDTPYNPNLPYPNADFPPHLSSATGAENHLYYQQQQQHQQQHTTHKFQSRAELIASKRRAKDRPWLNANSGSPSARTATINAPNNNNAAASSSGSVARADSSDDASADASTETSSSDESAYDVDSDEERSKTSVPSASHHASSTHASVSNLSRESRRGASGANDDNGDADDDDDLPLSVISSNSTHMNPSSQATVRRTKSAMPVSSPSPRSRYFGTIAHKLSSMSHRGSMKQSKPLRPKVNHQESGSRQQSSCPQSPKLASSNHNADGNEDTDDEDQPLNQIKSDLDAGTKHSLAQRMDCKESVHGFPTVPNEGDQIDGLIEDDGAASKKKRVLSERQIQLLKTLKSGMAKAKSKAEAADNHHKRDSSSSEGPDLSNASASGSLCSASIDGSLHSRSPSQLSSKEESVHGSVRTTEERDSDAMSHTSHHSRQSSDSKRIESLQPANDAPAKPKKERSYLPTGFGLPKLPVKSRAARARATVQYIALADIAENAKRAQRLNDSENELGEESDLDRDIDDTEKEKHLRRKLSRKDGAPFPEDGQNDTQSLASRNTASSSGGTLMEILRTGPVELLTASTDHSGSKAAIELISPEDYGDIDQLLSDLDGIMSGSLAARRRFSLAVMRHGIAVDNGLVEPVDYFEPEPTAEDAYHPSVVRESYVEFKPLEIAEFDTDAGGLLSEDFALDNILRPANDSENDGRTSNDVPIHYKDLNDDDTQPLSELAQRHSLFGDLETKMEALDVRNDVAFGSVVAAQPPLDVASQNMEQSYPRVLTRAEKVNKALEKLEVLNVRKVSIRIYIQDAHRYYTFSLTKYTTCDMLIGDMRKSRIIDADKDTWALFELVDYFGIERPLNHFENLMGIVESWEPRSNNYLILKGYSQQSLISLSGGIQLGDHAIQGMLYYRIKKSKWQKGVFWLQDHSMVLVKDGRGKTKKEAHYLTLTNNDVYTPFEPLRGAPTRFVFGLKSEMPMQMFEKPDEDYVKWFAVHTLDGLREWLKVLRLSKNQIKFCQMLERRIVDTYTVKDSEDKGPSTKPLVDLSLDKHEDAEGATRKPTGDICIEMVSMLNKIATGSKYDPAMLLKAVEQKGIDMSDLNVLSFGANGQQNGSNDDVQAPEALFLPGSLLSKPKKSATEAEANRQPDAELFVKGSLLSQPRESKALEASRAMQNVMAHNGNVFTQGSLLQVTQQTKPRPPHVGGAANVIRIQGAPLMQFDEPDFGGPGHLINRAGNVQYLPAGAHTPTMSTRNHASAAVPENQHVFGGLLAAANNTPQPANEQTMQSSNVYKIQAQSLNYR